MDTQKLYDSLVQATGLTVTPFIEDIIQEGIVFNYEPQTDNGIVATDRLTVRIIADNIENSLRYKKIVTKLLLTVGDETNNEIGYLDCYVNGGGTLRDSDTKKTHTIMYLYITRKSEVIL